MIHDWEAKSKLSIAIAHLAWIKGLCEIQVAAKRPGWESLKVIEDKVDRALADLSTEGGSPALDR